MKKVLFLLCVLITSTVFASDKTEEKLIDYTATNAGTNLVAIAPNDSSNQRYIYDGVKEFMVATASNLKVTTEHVYEVLVRQQVVYAITYLVILFLAILFAYFTYLLGNRVRWGGDGISARALFTVIMGFVTLALVIVFFCHIDTIITGLVNPEMGAIREIMDFIKDLNTPKPNHQ